MHSTEKETAAMLVAINELFEKNPALAVVGMPKKSENRLEIARQCLATYKTVLGNIPELSEYEPMEGMSRRLRLADQDTPSDDDNTYAIYFNITQPDGHDEGYEYRVWAKDIDEALGIFFTENPNINYNMVLDHDEI